MSQAITTGGVRKTIRLFGEAVRGQEQDYTAGSLRKGIFFLAVPMIIEMGMESVFALVDLFFVGRLGKHAVSTVGLTESVITIVYSVAVGLSMAATATVARRIGEKDKAGAARAAVQSLWLGVATVLPLSLAGMWWAPDILRLMGAEAETIRTGVGYTRIVMGSGVIITLLFLINGIFRGAGDASVAMRSLMVANGCNIVLCPVLINGWGPIPELGVTGAGVATAIGRSIGVVYQLSHLFGKRGTVQLNRAALRWDPPVLRNLVGVAWPATLQFIIASCSWIFLAQLVAQTGHSAASAGYQTAIRILLFFLLPAWGISNAAATLVGQNLGAGQPLRAEQAVLQTARYNAMFMAFITVLFMAGANILVGFFTTQPDVQQVAVKALRIMSAGYIFYGVGMVLINAFNGAGDTRTPTLINIMAFWCFQIPIAYLLARFLAWGPTGVFVAVPVAESLLTVIAWVLFRRGGWKKVKV